MPGIILQNILLVKQKQTIIIINDLIIKCQEVKSVRKK